MRISKLFLLYCQALPIIVSCNNEKRYTDTNYDQLSGTVTPVITTHFQGKTYPKIFEAAFYDTTKVLQGDMAYTFYNYNIGKINIESSKIIAGDPIVMHDLTPFTQVFPVGQFQVNIAIAKTANDERVAFSRIFFSTDSVARWEFALKKDQVPIPLRDTSFYCYGVDGGTGLFIDSIANKVFDQTERNNWNYVFIEKAKESLFKGYIHEFENHNLATFSTGYGDGCYATYVGFNKNGDVCRLLTDFGLVEWWKLEEK
jgi:hypothetical protein